MGETPIFIIKLLLLFCFSTHGCFLLDTCYRIILYMLSLLKITFVSVASHLAVWVTQMRCTQSCLVFTLKKKTPQLYGDVIHLPFSSPFTVTMVFKILFLCFLLNDRVEFFSFLLFHYGRCGGGALIWILAPLLTGALLSGYACVSHSFSVITQKTGRDPGVLCEEVVIAQHEGHRAKRVYKLHFCGMCSETCKL